MISNHLLKKAVVSKLTVMILVIGLSFAGPVQAAPPGYRHRPPYPKVGRFYRTLPGPAMVVPVGPKRYYYNSGVFYSHGPKGYRVVRAPRGAVVKHLPLGFERLVIAGVTYFLYAGVYYKRAPSGYVVVEAPPAETVTPQAPPRVEVIADRLNLRSGPGVNYSIIDTMNQGQVLLILEDVPEWYYVQLPNGDQGWVMSRYTRHLAINHGTEG